MTATEAVNSREDTRSIKAMPIQKRQKTSAAPSAKATVEKAKLVKSRRGSSAKRSWVTMKDYT
jgi:hypothetical protein